MPWVSYEYNIYFIEIDFHKDHIKAKISVYKQILCLLCLSTEMPTTVMEESTTAP